MWQFWDAFDIASADMIGFWELDCPVRVKGSKEVLATAYVQ